MRQLPKRQLLKPVLSAALGPQPVLTSVLSSLANPSRSTQPPLEPAGPQRA